MKTLLAGLLSVIGLLAQPSPSTVSQLVANNSVSLAGVVNISAFNTIGQNSHQLFMYTSDVTAGSCSSNVGFAGNIFLLGSVDGTTYSQISPPINNPIGGGQNTNVVPLLTSASGVYPYLQVQWSNTSHSVCKLTIWYTGSISPQAYSQSPRIVSDLFYEQHFELNTSGNNSIVNACGGLATNQTLVMYGFGFYNAASTTNTVVLKWGNASGYNVIGTWTATPQNFNMNQMPVASKPYFVGYAALNPSLTGAPTFTVNLGSSTEVDGWIVYRCE